MKQPLEQKPVMGGLNTKMPAVSLQPHESPDLLNVLVRDGSVRKRGGFVPAFRDRVVGDAVKNTPWRTTARETNTAGASDGDFIVSPGFMAAGHRKGYEGGGPLTISFRFCLNEEVDTVGGNAMNSASPYYPSPYDVQVMPLLSKGPIKKSAVSTGLSAANQWGSHSDAGCPFFVYLTRTSDPREWNLFAASHSFGLGSWELFGTATATKVVVGRTYHAIIVIDSTTLTLHLAEMSDGTLVYSSTSRSQYATHGWNYGPIQVFDCPQLLIEQTGTGSATQRPGLDYGGVADGGYWFASLRPPATIDDLVIFSEAVDAETLKGKQRFNYTGQPNVLNYWSLAGESQDYLREMTGQGNHLYFIPRGPISLKDEGKEGGSWAFNGYTSCAQIACDTKFWNYIDRDSSPAVVGPMYAAVRDNMPHGIAAEFWVDALEPAYEQVIAEIHGVLKLTVESSNVLKVYVRDGAVTGSPTTSLTTLGAAYQDSGVGVVVDVNRRYALAFVRDGSTAKLYLDGKLVSSATGLNPASYASVATAGNSFPCGTITLGIGGRTGHALIRAATPEAVPAGNSFNTNQRSGFFGRIETFRVLLGSESAELLAKMRPEDFDDWTTKQTRCWRSPYAANRLYVRPRDLGDTVRNVGRGLLAKPPGVRADLTPVGFAVADSSLPTQYFLHAEMLDPLDGNYIVHDAVTGMGMQLWYVLAYYNFRDTDEDANYAGSYALGAESIYPTTSTTVAAVPHPVAHTHGQFSSLGDRCGHLGGLRRLCLESDYIENTDAAVLSGTGAYTYRQRPYAFRSPRELGVQWTRSLADPGAGEPITLIADYDVPTEDRQHTIVAMGRNLYWAHRSWHAGTLEFTGDTGSYVLANTNAAADINVTYQSAGVTDTLQISGWVKPYRLDGVRQFVAKRSIADPRKINYSIYFQDGSLVVTGTMGANQWRFVEGVSYSVATAWWGMSTLRLQQWNHVCVQIGTGSVKAWINGQPVTLLDTSNLASGSDKTDAFAGTALDLPTGELYIGGYPLQMVDFSVKTLDFQGQSWCGSIADVHVRTTLDSSFTSTRGPVPTMWTADASDTYWWKLDEDDGWVGANSVAATSTYKAAIQLREFLLIASNLRVDSATRFSSVSFRDALLVSNGAEHPQEIRWIGWASKQQWSVRRIGMAAPVVWGTRLELLSDASASYAAPAEGLYQVAVSFLNVDGLESNPTSVGVISIGASADPSLLQIRTLPRSVDPQVVARRIYCSSTGGGPPITVFDVLDNETVDCGFALLPFTGTAAEFGARNPMPRAKHLAIAGSCLAGVDLTDEANGQNAFSFSRADEISYTTTGATVIIDSQDSKPLVGIGQILGQLFLSKRDSVHVLQVSGPIDALQIDASLRLVQSSDGIGGATRAANNVLHGCGDRGVFVFDSTNMVYLSQSIERTWRLDIDRSNDGLYAMQGMFWRAFSQYWISVRRVGHTSNDTILVYDFPTSSWTMLRVPEHKWVSTVESLTGSQQIVMGTADGMILTYSDDEVVDKVSSAATQRGAVTLQGSTGLSGSSTSLTMSGGNFHTILRGMQGATVTLTYDGVTAQRTIASNTADTIYWDEPLVGWTAFTSFVIGAIDAYWTSPWLRTNLAGKDQKCWGVDLEMLPETGSLDVAIAATQVDRKPERAWPVTGVETFSVSMATGRTIRSPQPRSQHVGGYHRFRFGTDGILDPFAILAYTPVWEQLGARNQPGRTS